MQCIVSILNGHHFNIEKKGKPYSQEDLAPLVARVSIRRFMIDFASYRSQTDISRGCQKIRAVAIFLFEVECQEIWMFLNR